MVRKAAAGGAKAFDPKVRMSIESAFEDLGKSQTVSVKELFQLASELGGDDALADMSGTRTDGLSGGRKNRRRRSKDNGSKGQIHMEEGKADADPNRERVISDGACSSLSTDVGSTDEEEWQVKIATSLEILGACPTGGDDRVKGRWARHIQNLKGWSDPEAEARRILRLSGALSAQGYFAGPEKQPTVQAASPVPGAFGTASGSASTRNAAKVAARVAAMLARRGEEGDAGDAGPKEAQFASEVDPCRSKYGKGNKITAASALA